MNSMEWLKEAFLFFFGLCGGFVIAAGLFSFLVSIGALTRIIGKARTADQIRLIENVVAAGVAGGNLVSLYQPSVSSWVPQIVGVFLLGLFGLCSGIFVGVLVMSLAENLNALPVFTHNLHMTSGVKYVIFFIAAGKGGGAWIDVLVKALAGG